MLDSRAKVLITADGVWRGEKLLLLKTICDEAMSKVKSHGHDVESCVVVAHLRRLNNPQGKDPAGGENATLFAFEIQSSRFTVRKSMQRLSLKALSL